MAPSGVWLELKMAYSPSAETQTIPAFERRRRPRHHNKCKAVADSLEEVRDRLFTFTRLPDSQWEERAHRSAH